MDELKQSTLKHKMRSQRVCLRVCAFGASPFVGVQLAETRSESGDDDEDHGVTSGRIGIE